MTDPSEPIRSDPDSTSGETPSVRRALATLRRLDREKERLFDRLARGERRFRRLARSVWKVQEEERRRLARELHDGIGQTLTALKNELALARRLAGDLPAPAAERLDAAADLAGRALDDTRQLSRLLRPQILDDLGLEAAFGWLLRTLGERSGIETHLAVRLPEAAGLPAEYQTLAFRVVQEALHNVEKHAAAGRVEVEVELLAEGRGGDGPEGSVLRLLVADDGRGFDPVDGPADRGEARGSGLGGQRDRLALFGGRLRVESRPGEGTRLEAVVPVGEEPEERDP